MLPRVSVRSTPKRRGRGAIAAATVAEQLAAADHALADGKPEHALCDLLSAWRTTRSTALAGMIDQVSRRIVRRPLGSGKLSAMQARWLALAKKRDPADVPRLLAGLVSGRAASVVARLEQLGELPDDPRVASGLATFCARPPYDDGVAMRKANEIARRVLVRAADERTIAILEPHAGRPEIAALIAEITTALPAVSRPLEAVERERLAALDRQLAGARFGDELLAAIHADPTDDGARAVYADWLLSQNDSRGELITLQLAAARGGLTESAALRERELLELHRRSMLGPLAQVIVDPVFARGFLVACTLAARNTRSLISAAAAHEWLTVEELAVSNESATDPGVFALPSFRNLRRLRGVSAAAARALASARTSSLLELLQLEYATSEAVARLFEGCTCLPRLTTFGVRAQIAAGAVEQLLATDVGKQLARLELMAAPHELEATLAAVTPNVREVQIAATWFDIACQRQERGAPWTVVLTQRSWTAQVAAALGAGVAAASPALVERVIVPETSHGREHLESALAPLADRLVWE
jgi:uncharacterized protein (TIGR02996 family)